MNTIPRTETPALITLMEHWAKTISKNGGVAAVTIQEGADRLRELETEVERLKKDQIECGNWIGNKMLQPEWDSFKKSLEVINHWKTRAEKAEEQFKILNETMQHVTVMYDNAMVRVEKASADTGRLDWLEREALEDWGIRSIDRASIDTAMKEASK